jgi:hypothetical protein
MNTTNQFNKTESPSDDELRLILNEIVNPDYKQHINDWIYYAKPTEKKGLFILSKVVKHRGQKIFKTQLIRTREEESDVSKLTMEEAYKRYQRKKTVSTYSEFYGGNLDEKYKYNNILKFKEFENVNQNYIIFLLS